MVEKDSLKLTVFTAFKTARTDSICHLELVFT